MSYQNTCPHCKHPFSDWFVWSNGLRHCFLCWCNSQYEQTWLEDGSCIAALKGKP